MIFETDVFISYAHIDNVPLMEGEKKGWISNFHETLTKRLVQLMGSRKINVWRDKKLNGNDFFGDEIVDQLHKSAIMISILSPGYIKSEWCMKELKEFNKAAENGIGTRIDNKSRIFKVIKTPIPEDEHPGEIAQNIGYNFFIKKSTENEIELSQYCDSNHIQIYKNRLEDIARDVCDLLKKIKQSDEPVIPPQEDKIKIYLADTSSYLEEQREIIKRELLERGFEVLPDCRLPLIESEFKKKVENFLDQSKLSIHVVGGSYGMVPEDSRKSIVALQNELAIEKSKTGKLKRLIWIPSDCAIDIEDERQKNFIHQVRTDRETQFGADMFEKPVKDFKNALHDKLESIVENGGGNGGPPPGVRQVYLICDLRDLNDITDLEDCLYKREFDVIPPAFEGEEEKLMQDHWDHLETCDAVIIYYGWGNDLWLRAKLRDIWKIAGYGRTRPIYVKAIFLAPPVTPVKEHVRRHDWFIIEGMQGFSPELMEPFTATLQLAGK